MIASALLGQGFELVAAYSRRGGRLTVAEAISVRVLPVPTM
ncbi:MAG: hypothetical protein ACRD0H_25885 [Actinomycetes bacterium]